MRKLILVLLAVTLMVAVQAETTAAVLNVEEISISQYKDFWDGAADSTPYGFEVFINGTGISSVSVVDPHSGNHVLSDFGGGEWGFEDWDFASLIALDASYGAGSYAFTFNAGGLDEDTVTINYAYTEPTGFADITYPADGQTNVELNPVYTWASVVGYGDALGMWIIEDPTGLDNDLYENVPVFDMNTTSWQPGPLAALTVYEFEITVITAQGSVPTEMQTVGLDGFNYYGLFEHINMLGFETAPLPGDFDEDGDVDAFDFADWKANYPTASGATLAMGDADNDGDVDGFDFADWQANYPYPPQPQPEPTPEPATLGLLLLGGVVLLRRRK